MVNLNQDQAIISYTNMDPTSNDNEQKQEPPKTRYSMPSVLHFLQHEWARFELERAQWDMERAELQARIAFLQGERKGQENLQHDLIKRIKMLERALREERDKNWRREHPNEPYPWPMDSPESQDHADHVSAGIDAEAAQSIPNSNMSWRQGRQLLRQYLNEIGYNDTMLDVRSYRMRNILNIPAADGKRRGAAGSDSGESAAAHHNIPGHLRGQIDGAVKDSNEAVNVTMDFLRGINKKEEEESDSDEEIARKADAELDILDSVLDQADRSTRTGDEKWQMNENVRHAMNQYKQEVAKLKERHDSVTKSQDHADVEYNQPTRFKDPNQGLTIDGALGLMGIGAQEADVKDEFQEEIDSQVPKKWNLHYQLRNHFDAVRCMQFHPVEPLLCTASEDGTMKLWNLAKCHPDDSKLVIADLEPIYTFRGHTSAVLSLVLSPTGDMAYTGGLDGTVRCWLLPPPTTDPTDKFDPKVLTETLNGHSDGVWSVAFHSSDNRLLSASADGTIKLWEPGAGSNQQPLKTYNAPTPNGVPIAVDFVSTEPQQIVAAYAPGTAMIIDLETGQTLMKFKTGAEHENVHRLTAVCPHPTLPMTVTAGDDKHIRFFDNNTGELIDDTVGHVDAVSCLALDPNGLYLLSGAHDGSLRLWNTEKRICLQEISAHRQKFDESILSVAFHPSRPLIGSAGADGYAKVYA